MLLRRTSPYDLQGLEREVTRARGIQDFSEGLYGHCVSLPGPTDLADEYRTHHNNLPFANALASCPVMRDVFDGFRTPKASFRLLRRAPRTAYGLHDDRDKGDEILRVQIPIVTNPDAFICVMKDDVSEDELAAEVAGVLDQGDLHFDFERFARTVGPWFDLYYLEPGFLYHFDTNRIHTAINAGAQERIVLGIDLVQNEWLSDWMRAEIVDPVEPTPQEAIARTRTATWEWTSLGHGLIKNPTGGGGGG